MSAAGDPVYEVTYKNITRKIRRSELKRAPDSLISKIFLQDIEKEGDRTLVIPSDGTAPRCAVWRDGDADLFEVLARF